MLSRSRRICFPACGRSDRFCDGDRAHYFELAPPDDMLFRWVSRVTRKKSKRNSGTERTPFQHRVVDPVSYRFLVINFVAQPWIERFEPRGLLEKIEFWTMRILFAVLTVAPLFPMVYRDLSVESEKNKR